MNKQKQFVLAAAAMGTISMFLPWGQVTLFGIKGDSFKGTDVVYSFLPLFCFISVGIICFLNDQKENLKSTAWFACLILGAIAAIYVFWHLIKMNAGYTSRFGIYLAALSAVGVVAAAFMYRAPGDTIKGGFDSFKKDIDDKMKNTGGTPPNNPNPPM